MLAPRLHSPVAHVPILRNSDTLEAHQIGPIQSQALLANAFPLIRLANQRARLRRRSPSRGRSRRAPVPANGRESMIATRHLAFTTGSRVVEAALPVPITERSNCFVMFLHFLRARGAQSSASLS